ncbi:hypothetical protein NKG94_11135 [Micromonospora sp. M12]
MGKAPSTADGGSAPANTPVRIETLDDAVTNFARRQAGNVVRNASTTPLSWRSSRTRARPRCTGSRWPATTTPLP